jgi:hypothetical protein
MYLLFVLDIICLKDADANFFLKKEKQNKMTLETF